MTGRSGRGIALVLYVAVMVIAPSVAPAAVDWSAPYELLGRETAPGTKNKFPFIDDRSFEA